MHVGVGVTELQRKKKQRTLGPRRNLGFHMQRQYLVGGSWGRVGMDMCTAGAWPIGSTWAVPAE